MVEKKWFVIKYIYSNPWVNPYWIGIIFVGILWIFIMLTLSLIFSEEDRGCTTQTCFMTKIFSSKSFQVKHVFEWHMRKCWARCHIFKVKFKVNRNKPTTTNFLKTQIQSQTVYRMDIFGLEVVKIQPPGTTTFPSKNCFKIILGKRNYSWINSKYFFLILQSAFQR